MKWKMGLAMVAVASLLTPTLASAGDGVSAEETLQIEEGTRSTDVDPVKLDVLAVWSHPDDDAGIIAPCGVWGDLDDIDCGIMLTTRGEGGSNSVGPEAGPDLGLRRENEDRASHVRAGTVDLYYLDKVDFFYNTSAPLTEQAWGEEDVLRRAVRVVRETQPEILVGWTGSVTAGHGNHQYAGRLTYDIAAAASDPTMFPEQLEGPNAVDTWQVKKVVQQMWRAPAGTGIVTNAPNCMANYTPSNPNAYTVHGTWTGYESEYEWVEGNTAGVPAGTKKSWAQVGREDGQLHATQARTMVKGVVDPGCVNYLVGESWVPMQELGTTEAGNDLAVHYGASIQDPGGMPIGTIYYPEATDYFAAPGESTPVTLTVTAGDTATPAGTATVEVPEGWSVDSDAQIPALAPGETVTVDFSVNVAAGETPGVVRLPVRFAGDGVTAYNETHVEVTAPVDGRFSRWGNFLEFEEWTDASGVRVEGNSPAINQIGAGESVSLDVDVTNRTSEPASGTVAFDVPDGFSLDQDTVAFENVAPGETEVVTATLTHLDPSDLGGRIEKVSITTTSGTSVAEETMDLYVVPTTVIPELESAPSVDGNGDEYTAAIDVSSLWEEPACENDVDCGADSTAKLGWYDDAAYMWIDVVDDTASAAATPDRCFGHWLVDSVEVQLDPLGNGVDTSSTFKLGIFPFTEDAENWAGNGVNGPCWTRDADNHQGFSSGPLAADIEGGLNAEGVEVAVNVERDGNSYVGGRYQIEVKIPLDQLPAATGPTSAAPTGDAATNDLDPTYMGLNVSPYDTDNQSFVGETRLAWSAFGSQQSEPYRWGHAYLDGYEPPADRSTEVSEPIIPNTALQGAESPQTVYQSATTGNTIAGLQPNTSVDVTPSLSGDTVNLAVDGATEGTVRAFVWQGDPTYIPVWTSSCAVSEYGNDACSASDGQARPWAPDMGGRLLASAEGDAATGALAVDLAGVEVDTDQDVYLLVSYADATEVAAWSFPVTATDAPEEPTAPTKGNLFFVANSWTTTSADETVVFGRKGDEVLVGDWDGDGKDTLGVRRGNQFFLDNSIKSGNADISFRYGKATDEVLVGDWDGDGTDTTAIRRGNAFHVKNTLVGGSSDVSFRYGKATDEAYVGDFDGDDTDTITVRRGNTFYVANALAGGPAAAQFNYGKASDEVFIGTYQADASDTIALRRGNVFHVKYTLTGGNADISIGYGRASDKAYVGDFDGDGIDTPVVNRYVK
ncbi:MAG: sugar-binding protein [Flaviflexus sp.]|uniref:sugar-binding protein n=1 Tax=Flaviflexus sp. TaxID=1969482 RepID=UPI00352D619B